uniref:Uncharacterized protein n=1 Tax=Oryza barthii TaxID=65489 RepID=A0A0D3HH01_9ORYZ
MATERLLNYMPPAIMLQAEIALSELIQSSPEEALHDYILGVLAPDPPFSDEIFKAAEKPQTVVISRYCRVQNLRRCGQLTPASGKKMARE